jgi:hypothetical protein
MRVLFLNLLIICTLSARAQMGASFDEAKASGVRISLLDSTYKSAVHVNERLSAFPGKGDKVAASYNQMIQDLGAYLDKHNFKWGQTVHCFNRIYFNKDGSIDYFLYSLKDKVGAEKEAEFKRLLNEFIRQYKFPMHGKVKFAQCSPVTYQS